jgi:hypothetical protein
VSAHITIGCEREFQYGLCPGSVYVFGADTVEQARAAAGARGWYRRAGRDICPMCAGSKRPCPQIISLR